MQQTLLWAQYLGVRQKYFDILVDIYADRLLHTDFTHIPQNIVLSGLPMTLNLDKAVAKNLVIRILKSYFSEKEKHYSIAFDDLSIGRGPENIEKIKLKKISDQENPFLFLRFDTRSELLVRSTIIGGIVLPLGSDVVDAALSEHDATKLVSITNKGRIDLYHAESLKSSSHLIPQSTEIDDASILYGDKEKIYIGFGQTLHVFDAHNILENKQSIVIDEPNCRITYLSWYKNVMAVTCILPSGEYTYKYFKHDANSILIEEKKPSNTWEVVLTVQYNNKLPVTEKKMLLLGDNSTAPLSLQDILQARGFDHMDNCYDMIIDAYHRKIYTIIAPDDVTKHTIMPGGPGPSNLHSFRIREYAIIPTELKDAFDALHQQVLKIESEQFTGKEKAFLTLDVLALIATSYQKIGPIKISANLKKQVSSMMRTTMPSGFLSRTWQYLRRSYLGMGGYTKKRIIENAVWLAILGGVVALAVWSPQKPDVESRYYP
jgi:hypothetical protein